ncbi:MAG: 3-dehydroquinate synthase [Alphaproteobacteria bacterium]
MKINTVHISLGDRSYDISIGAGLIDQIHSHIPDSVQGRKVFIVTDENVTPYAGRVRDALRDSGASWCDVLSLPFGEKTKSYDHLIHVHDWMLSHNIHRNSLVVAVGGGVIGDLAGFAAASIMRGVPFVQVPTTLLSQVDSSVGGKTGINTAHGKNLVGAFYQPISVVIDIDSLKTLPRREVLAGYAEVVKYGLIADKPFFDWLDENGGDVINLDHDAVAYAIETSCKAKAKVVEEDEREGGRRALLNLGHTFGHALEAAAGYDGSLLHGEGVSIGTVMAFDLSVRMGLCPEDDLAHVREHFRKMGLPVDARAITASPDELIATMRKDKKSMDDTMVFIVVNHIGSAFVSKDVPEDLVRAVLVNSLEGK